MDANGWLVCSQTRSALAKLDGVLRKAIETEDVHLRVMALHLIERGGKRLRPALLFLAASFGAADRDVLLRAAAALELIHVASLYHDDVMDRALLRRHAASANERWGNALATFAGTYLFARSSALLASVGHLPNELASRASVELCIGQLHEVEHAYNLDLDEQEHLEILTKKTATLFELPCRLGAHLSDASDVHTEALLRYGGRLGLAFQLVDDALDLSASTEQIGKAAGKDLREGVYSLPVLRALRRAPGCELLRPILGQARLTDEDIDAALRIVQESGAVDETLALARQYAREAREAVHILPEGAATQSLDGLAEYALSRSY
jgi:heptaprenyl diphosphate synthase